MKDPIVLQHHDALRGRKTQSLLPRYRLRNQQKYVFAARLKKAPYWLVVSEDSWGMVSEEFFQLDYIESNEEAKKLSRLRSTGETEGNATPLGSVK